MYSKVPYRNVLSINTNVYIGVVFLFKKYIINIHINIFNNKFFFRLLFEVINYLINEYYLIVINMIKYKDKNINIQLFFTL